MILLIFSLYEMRNGNIEFGGDVVGKHAEQYNSDHKKKPWETLLFSRVKVEREPPLSSSTIFFQRDIVLFISLPLYTFMS